MRRNARTQHRRRGSLITCGAIAVVGAVVGLGEPGQAQSGQREFSSFSGHANGGSAKLVRDGSPTIRLGKIAAQSLGCAFDTTDSSNRVASASLVHPDATDPTLLIQSGTVTNEGAGTNSPLSVSESSTVEKVNLKLGTNTLEATLVRSQAKGKPGTMDYTDEHGNVHSIPTIDPEGTGATFVDLTINGVPRSATPSPNTEIPLGSVGKVILNRVMYTNTDPSYTLPDGKAGSKNTKTLDPGDNQVRNIAIQVQVYNLAGYAGNDDAKPVENRKGAPINIAFSRVSLESGEFPRIGQAFGLSARAGNNVIVGKQNVVNAQCDGDPAYVEDTQVGFNQNKVAPPISSATMFSAVESPWQFRINQLGFGSDAGRAIAMTENLVIRDTATPPKDRIVAELIESHSNVESASPAAANDDGTKFVNLRIDQDGDGTLEQTIDSTGGTEQQEINDQMALPGLGVLTINRQTCEIREREDTDQPFHPVSNKIVAKPKAITPGLTDGQCTGEAGAKLRVTGLHLALNVPSPLGTEVRVSEAMSGLLTELE